MGGYTRVLPKEDRYLWTRSQFEDTLAWALGGHAAEKLVYGEMTTGAENDIERATNIARRMITEFGMSERLGPVALGHKEELIFLGREIGEQKNYSEKIAEAIDEELHGLIERAYDRARGILEKHRAQLDLVAQTLVKEETIEGEAFEALLRQGSENGQESAPPELAAEAAS